MKRHNTLLLGLGVFFLMDWSTAFAAPTISSITGTIAENNHLVIDGTSLGTNTTIGTADLQWLGSAIEAGTIGNSVNGIATGWTDYRLISDSETTNSAYDNTYAHSGTKSILNYYYHTDDHNPNRYKGYFRWDSGKDLTSIYLTFWVKIEWPEVCQTSGCQWKIWRLNNTGLNTDNYPDYYQNCWTSGMREQIMHSDSGYSNHIPPASQYIAADQTPGPNAIENTWVRMEYWFVESDEGVANGTIQYWMHNPGVGIKNPLNLIGNQVTRDVPRHFKYAVFGHVSGVPNLKVWWDDIFIQVGTQTRIEIGDAPTWNACTHREIQIPTAWSETKIDFTLNLGSFEPKPQNGLFLYIVDANGNVNQTGHVLVPPKPPIPSMSIQ